MACGEPVEDPPRQARPGPATRHWSPTDGYPERDALCYTTKPCGKRPGTASRVYRVASSPARAGHARREDPVLLPGREMPCRSVKLTTAWLRVQRTGSRAQPNSCPGGGKVVRRRERARCRRCCCAKLLVAHVLPAAGWRRSGFVTAPDTSVASATIMAAPLVITCSRNPGPGTAPSSVSMSIVDDNG